MGENPGTIEIARKGYTISMAVHHCSDKQFPCFDCKQMICAECVKPDIDTLRCEPCHERVTRTRKGPWKPAANERPKKMVLVGAASVFFSFVALTAMNMLAFCMT